MALLTINTIECKFGVPPSSFLFYRYIAQAMHKVTHIFTKGTKKCQKNVYDNCQPLVCHNRLTPLKDPLSHMDAIMDSKT